MPSRLVDQVPRVAVFPSIREGNIIRPQKLYEQVAKRLETAILEQRYKPGDYLPSERDLMKVFGVGRPAIREALFALSRMGLVLLHGGERAQVTQPTPSAIINELGSVARHLLMQPGGVKNFQAARLLFEVGLARYAAEHATDADVDRLHLALKSNKAALGNTRVFETTDVEFHRVLAEISRNPVFLSIYDAMTAWLTEQRSVALRHTGFDKKAYTAHARIYQAVAARDPEQAGQAMELHLKAVNKQFWLSVAGNARKDSTQAR